MVERALQRIRIFGLAALLASFMAATNDVRAAPDRKAVLVLNSYHWGFAWTNAQVDGITAVLKESGLHTEVFLEHMDVLRLPAPYEERGFADYLGRRYRAQRFDLVIATDDAALSFAVRHHASLFAGTPVVFSDAAAFDAETIAPGIPITGVMERVDIPSTVQAAQRMRPRATQIMVYANRADAGSGFDHARDTLRTLKTSIPIRINHDLGLDEIIASAAALSPEDIVFVLAAARDAGGKWYSPADVIARVGIASPAPIFDITSHRVRSGLTLGGKVEDGSEVGRAAAQMAVRILNGEDARRIPVQVAPVTHIYNYGRMQRHGISESDLPEGSVVVGKPPTMYDQHRSTVLATAAVVVALCLAVLVLINNIRRRQGAEEALRRSEERLRQAIRVSGIGIFDHDHLASSIYWSPELRDLFDWGPDEPRNFDAFLEAVHPGDREHVLAAIRRSHDSLGDGQYVTEYRIVDRSGAVRWVFAMGQTTFEGEGESRRPLRTVGATLDFTARKLAEEALRQANEELDERVRVRTEELAASNVQLRKTLESLRHAQEELIRSEKLASLGSLVAGVAHELGTPLGNSLMVATTLSDKTREFSEKSEGKGLSRSALRDYVAVATQATRLLARSLLQANDLLTHFKQVAVDQTSAQRRAFDLAATIAEIVATLQPLYKATPHRIRLEIPAGIVMDSYPGPLGQLITNLANNALVHGFDHAEAGVLEIDVSERGSDFLTMTVRDNGCGIPADRLPRIFDPFYTTRLGQGGSGLGLHIVYSIVTRVLGGRIEVHSTPGKGTTFTLELPMRAPDAQPAAAAWAALPPAE